MSDLVETLRQVKTKQYCNENLFDEAADCIEEMKDALLKAGMALVLSDTTNFPRSVKLDGKLWAEAKTAVDRILLEQGWIEED